MNIKLFSLFLVSALAMLGCQSKPVLPVPPSNPPVAAVQDKPGAYKNQQVTWGGIILTSEAKEKATEITILAKRLETSTRPIESDQSLGRFIARIPGFLDPAVYAEGRELSVNGVITGTETRKVGDYDYTHPVVNVSSHHLWAVRVKYDDNYYWDPWYGPWYYPYPYYYPHYHRQIQEVR